jgi:hypothetical protein
VDSLLSLVNLDTGTGGGQVEADADTEILAQKHATEQIAWEREWEEIQQQASGSRRNSIETHIFNPACS